MTQLRSKRFLFEMLTMFAAGAAYLFFLVRFAQWAAANH